MHLTRLALSDFRSYESADLTLSAGVSTFLGANGQGKTNLVEAAAYLATLGSHRVASDTALVRRGAEQALVRGVIASGGRDTLVEIEINPGRSNRARVNRAALPRPREVLGLLRTVMFAPEDLSLVKGDPDQRRRFLDDLLVATAPRYAGVRADYERVLRQRTALLKTLRARPGWVNRPRAPAARRGSGPGDPSITAESGDGPDPVDSDGPAGSPARMLEVWDDQLATVGADLLAARLRLTAALRPRVARAYAEVAGDGPGATISDRASAGPGTTDRPAGADPSAGGEPEPPPDRAALAAALREALSRLRAEEIERGVCLAGPHRDDLDIVIGELPARGYASHGESWSAALALRLAAYELLRAGGDEPVLLLDDVFAELDAGRRDRLAGLVSGAEQVLVTAAVSADVPAMLTGDRFTVTEGSVTHA